jgi:hypothetical protein
MKELAYSSTAAFLAHYRSLSNAAAKRDCTYPLSKLDQEVLEAVRAVMEALTPEERTILVADAVADDAKCLSGEERRRRERAQLKLQRLLLARRILRA